MTSTLDASVSSNGARSRTPGIAANPHRHRNLPLALVALACMAVSVVAFVGIQLASSDRRPVLAVARAVPAGAVLTDADLTIAEVGDDPALSPIPLADKASAIGHTAAVDLRPGPLLVAGALGEPPALANGEALAGIEVSAAAAPVGSLRTGDRVRLVEVTKQEDTRGTTQPRVLADGRVMHVASAGTGPTAVTQLTVVVPADASAAVAAASAGQWIAVVVVP
jgi:hypothetical protein